MLVWRNLPLILRQKVYPHLNPEELSKVLFQHSATIHDTKIPPTGSHNREIQPVFTPKLSGRFILQVSHCPFLG